jgi:hypothetical protein
MSNNVRSRTAFAILANMTDATRDDDFYLWTRQQAAALRAHAKRSGDNAVDWPAVIEEFEDMGKSD